MTTAQVNDSKAEEMRRETVKSDTRHICDQEEEKMMSVFYFN